MYSSMLDLGLTAVTAFSSTAGGGRSSKNTGALRTAVLGTWTVPVSYTLGDQYLSYGSSGNLQFRLLNVYIFVV